MSLRLLPGQIWSPLSNLLVTLHPLKPRDPLEPRDRRATTGRSAPGRLSYASGQGGLCQDLKLPPIPSHLSPLDTTPYSIVAVSLSQQSRCWLEPFNTVGWYFGRFSWFGLPAPVWRTKLDL